VYTLLYWYLNYSIYSEFNQQLIELLVVIRHRLFISDEKKAQQKASTLIKCLVSGTRKDLEDFIN
jgi:hypothetical protein